MIEEKLKQLIKEIFGDKKRLCAGDFWRRMELSVGDLDKTEIDCEVYQGIAELYKQNYIGLESGNYILVDGNKSKHL
jgi:hypothetical protein